MDFSASGSSWAIATAHRLATEAGGAAFEHGGNAIDAALAAAVTIAVTYPQACGVGGDLFALVQRPAGDVVAINASGRAPLATDVDTVRRAGDGSMPEHGPFSITVPGAVSGWKQLHGQGSALPWADAFDPAIAAAYEGVEVSGGLAETLTSEADRLAADPGMRSTFFREGRPLDVGDRFVQPALGSTLEALAAQGPGALYRSDVGSRYVDGLRSLGCPIALRDLEAHEAELGSPLRARYRDLDILVSPPNSQGFALLEILACVERIGIDPDPFGADASALALAIRGAAADRDRHLADPEHMRIHPSTLLDDGHLASLGDDIRAGLAGPAARSGPSGLVDRPAAGDTIALVVADAQGFAISLIQSLFDGLGSGILEPDTGIVAHSRGACFTLEPGHPNELAPGKRPAHTLLPVIAQREGRPAIVAGTMGGYAQPQIDASTLIRRIDLGESPAGAVAAPRWLSAGMDLEQGDPFVLAEVGVPQTTRDSLRRNGFRVEGIAARSGSAGHAHMIAIGADGGFVAGSDPRADGGALAS
jgi:gamma-glutamyltranspeptidase